MLRAELGNLQGDVGGIYYILPYTIHFIAENYGVFLICKRLEIIQFDGACSLLCRDYGVALCLERIYGLEGVFGVLPWHAFLRAKGRFVNLGRGRRGADAAKPDFIGFEAVGATEGGADVMRAADVVEHYGETTSRRLPVGLGTDSSHLRDK